MQGFESSTPAELIESEDGELENRQESRLRGSNPGPMLYESIALPLS